MPAMRIMVTRELARPASIPQPLQYSLPARLDGVDPFERFAFDLVFALLLEVAIGEWDLARDSIGVGVTEVLGLDTDYASAFTLVTRRNERQHRDGRWRRDIQKFHCHRRSISAQAKKKLRRRTCDARAGMYHTQMKRMRMFVTTAK
jgi:hypothetical protein